MVAWRERMPVSNREDSQMDQRSMRALVITMVAAACANDVHVRYPAAPDQPTGTMVLQLSQPASDVNVAINGILVVEDAHTERIVITNAPAGSPEIVMTANGADRQIKPWLGSDETATIPLGVPDAG